MEKKCLKCEIIKDLSQYHNQKSCSDGKATRCKTCRNEENKTFKVDNPQYMREYKRNRRRETKKKIITYLGGCCSRCGVEDIPDIYDIHHTDPSKKDKQVSELGMSSWTKIQKELDSGVILLCANCHRKVHYRNRPNYKGN